MYFQMSWQGSSELDGIWHGGSLSSGHDHNTLQFLIFKELPNLQGLKVGHFEKSQNF
jgi:hypothetical protein